MSEPSPEHDLNNRARHSHMEMALRRCMQQEGLRVVLEQTPKAVVGGAIAFPHKDAPDSNFLIIVARYDADIAMPSGDGIFYDVHIVARDDSGANRYVISDVAACSAEPFCPLGRAMLYESLEDDAYNEVSSLLAYTTYDASLTEEALECLEWYNIIDPRGTIDVDQPDMPFYDLTRILKREWQG
ncbi:MAG: hypothetical protein ACQR33_02170 [Candidatus Saccharibacteria bacterium]